MSMTMIAGDKVFSLARASLPETAPTASMPTDSATCCTKLRMPGSSSTIKVTGRLCPVASIGTRLGCYKHLHQG